MFKELLSEEFAPYGSLSPLQLSQLEDHYLTLTRWNERLNLTRIRGLEDSVRFHYCESLFLARFLPSKIRRIVDVGSGGGFPGVPVAVFRPDCEVTLIDCHQRKAVFLREATRELANVSVISTRAESTVVGVFDWLISRAVSPGEILGLEIAPNTALLIGEDDAALLNGTTIPVPWGNRRVLFHVEPKTPSSN